jgi:hypothetical protein
MIIDDNFLTEEEILGYQKIFYYGDGDLPWIILDNDVEFQDQHIPEYKKYKYSVKNKISERVKSFNPSIYSLNLMDGSVEHHYLSTTASEIFYKFAEKNNIEVKSLDAITIRMARANILAGNSTHVDMPYPHQTLIYYVNNSSGDTLFFNREFSGGHTSEDLQVVQRVSPKAGRAAMFDGLIYHSASTPQSGFRCIVNINFNVEK